MQRISGYAIVEASRKIGDMADGTAECNVAAGSWYQTIFGLALPKQPRVESRNKELKEPSSRPILTHLSWLRHAPYLALFDQLSLVRMFSVRIVVVFLLKQK
jgi:hypothetical protein